MPLVKKTDEGKKWRLDKINSLKDRRESVKRLAAMKVNPEWRDLKKILDSFVEMAEKEHKLIRRDARTRDESSESIRLRICEVEQKIDDFNLVIDLVENSDKNVEHLNLAIEKQQEEYKSYLEEN